MTTAAIISNQIYINQLESNILEETISHLFLSPICDLYIPDRIAERVKKVKKSKGQNGQKGQK